MYLLLTTIHTSAKAALTAARTSAHAIYVTPSLQAELDDMSGTLHCEERDYTTAYSYFLEAHEGYEQAGNAAQALSTMQYMILCKVLQGAAQEVPTLLASKVGLKHRGVEIEAMESVAIAAKEKSLDKFKASVRLISDLLLFAFICIQLCYLFMFMCIDLRIYVCM